MATGPRTSSRRRWAFRNQGAVAARGRLSALLVVFLAVGTLAVGAPARADDPDSLRAQAERLEEESARLGSSEHAALLELYALETSLGRAERRLAALERRSAQLEAEQAAARRRLEVARTAEAVAQQRLEERLTALYVEGDPDPFEIILGASSLDEVISAFDGLSRLAAEDARISREAGSTRLAVRRALRQLAAREAELRDLLSDAEATSAALRAARDEKAAYVASLRSQRRLNAAEIDELTTRAAEAERRTAELEAAPSDVPTRGTVASPPAAAHEMAAAPPGRPGRQLTVDAVAYSLPGYTASGLPVGKGVVAVDPTVIPLGTRMYVPGYGPAVAADTGSAIKGLIIDLWFPTYEQAAAWGRRTVTITIYG